MICKIDPAALLYLNNGLFMRVRSTGDFKGWSLNARGVWPLTISEYLHRGSLGLFVGFTMYSGVLCAQSLVNLRHKLAKESALVMSE